MTMRKTGTKSYSKELNLALLENAQDLSKLTDTAHFKHRLLILAIDIVLFAKLLDYGLCIAGHVEQAVILTLWEHGNLKTDTSIYYSTT